MNTVKLPREKIIDYLGKISTFLNQNLEEKLSYALIRVKQKLESEAKTISRKVQELENERIKLCIEYCQKDKDNKPVMIVNQGRNTYAGLDQGTNPEFDEKMDAWHKKREGYLEEEIIVKDIYGINKSLIPQTMNGTHREALLPFITKEKEELKIN